LFFARQILRKTYETGYKGERRVYSEKCGERVNGVCTVQVDEIVQVGKEKSNE